MSNDEIDSIMSDWGSKYSRQNRQSNYGKIGENIKHLKALLSKKDTVLDVGCGEGVIASMVGHPSYYGIDVSKEAIDYIGNERFKVGNLFDLSGEWDVVFCCRVLMHLPKFHLAMEKLLAACRKYCVIVVPLGEDKVVTEEYGGNVSYYRTFSRETLESAGRCQIKEFSPYSTVIYGPALSA